MAGKLFCLAIIANECMIIIKLGETEREKGKEDKL